jgi:hypothetical protein
MQQSFNVRSTRKFSTKIKKEMKRQNLSAVFKGVIVNAREG